MSRDKLFFFFFFFLISIYPDFSNAKTEKYRCMWKEDPSTTMVIGWNQLNGDSPLLYLDTTAVDLNIQNTVSGIQAGRTVRYKKMNNHFVHLSGLQSNTTYYFLIKDSNSESEIMSFTTLPNDNSALSIIAGGDSRNHRTNRQNANKMVAKLKPHLVMFGGDMTGSDGSRSWKNWLNDWQLTIGDDGHMVPIVVARGNHERNNTVIHNLFDVPNPDVYYALTLGDNLVRVYTLNSLIASGGRQRDWLENDLDTSQTVKWKIAQYHHPMRPHTYRKGEKPSQQKYWAPLFQEYEVDLVVECDAHVVKTTYPIRPSREKGSEEGFIRDDKNGTVYVGEGCWGAPLRKNNDDKSWTRASGSFNQFKWIFIDYDKIEIRTVKTHNPEEIPQLDFENRFSVLPELDIWAPESGDVVTIGTSSPFDNDEIGLEREKSEVEYHASSLAQTQKSKWNKFAVTIFFVILILVMLYPLYPNLKQLKLFSYINGNK